ncbi:hypothetical protein [Flavobacterium facile]|uniref:hypothetical protein n=1 Tax=Flavobacterium facile TaxID=2893174 RepID=UPI002E78E26E|nr:hypothetical protein [Flavobacterium sp. T-12]
MITKTESLERYKEAIKAKFEEEKKGIYSSFLISPSRAKLRQLCEEKLKTSTNSDDLNSFKFLFGFDFDASNKNKLQANTDKFRPIETFLKKETDLTDIEAINITALLVDFKPRPFRVFNAKSFGVQSLSEEVEIVELNTNEKERNTSHLEIKTTESRNNLKKKIAIGFFGLIGIGSVGYAGKSIVFSEPECMQWQKNHFEVVDCQSDKQKGFMMQSEIIPFDENKSQLIKIEVSDTTTFFKNEKPLYWYCKVNGKPEFFNTHGLHPETGKALKPVSQYIINKYVK